MQATNAKEKITRTKTFLQSTAVVLFIVTLGVLYCLPITSYWHKCAVCHLSQNTRVSVFGTHTSTKPTICSEWCAENLKAPHEHKWVKNKSYGFVNIFGVSMGGGSGGGRYSWIITPEEQLEIYKSVPSQKEARELFLSIDETALDSPENAYSGLTYLRAWPDQESPVPWSEAKRKTLDLLEGSF